ncbi:MAG: tail fiber protein [Ignavibacteria bacterium]|nr:tail fiber protein [Ignavibacteria bacterium]
MNKFFACAAIVAAILVSNHRESIAQIPGTISYQGVLSDATGKPVSPDGKYSMTFEIRNSGGTLLWSESYGELDKDSISVTGGLFNVYLGKKNNKANSASNFVNLSELTFNEPYFITMSLRNYMVNLSLNDKIPFSSTGSSFNSSRINGVGVRAIPKIGDVLKYDGTNWVAGTDNTTGTATLPAVSGDTGIVITIDQLNNNAIKITGGNIRNTDGGLVLTSSSGKLTINLGTIPLKSLERSGADTGQVLKWNGNSWSPSSDVPVGSVMAYAGENTLPSGWLFCDGLSMNIDSFPQLYKVIGKMYGSLGAAFFSLPDYRGTFLRGLDSSYNTHTTTTRDPDRWTRTKYATGLSERNRVGSVQSDALELHRHFVFEAVAAGAGTDNEIITQSIQGNLSKFVSARGDQFTTQLTDNSYILLTKDGNRVPLEPNTGPTGLPMGTTTTDNANTTVETRPKNTTVNWIIKAK